MHRFFPRLDEVRHFGGGRRQTAASADLDPTQGHGSRRGATHFGAPTRTGARRRLPRFPCHDALPCLERPKILWGRVGLARPYPYANQGAVAGTGHAAAKLRGKVVAPWCWRTVIPSSPPRTCCAFGVKGMPWPRGRSPRNSPRFVLLPFERLSRTCTGCSWASRRWTTQRPMKPAPPMTRMGPFSRSARLRQEGPSLLWLLNMNGPPVDRPWEGHATRQRGLIPPASRGGPPRG